MKALFGSQLINDGKVLYLAFELGENSWKLAFTNAAAQDPRMRDVPAGDRKRLLDEIAEAKRRFKLPADAPVLSCYEAGREGFFLHRWLVSVGIDNLVVDSASIEVNRKQRRAKTDALDACSLVRLLMRHASGEKKVWHIVRIPSVEDEQHRHLHRQLNQLKAERLALANEMKAQLRLVGVLRIEIGADFPTRLESLVDWNDMPLSLGLKARLKLDFQRWQLVDRQIKDLENDRTKRIRNDSTPHVEKIRRLLTLRGIGKSGSWLLVYEMFGWRKFDNRKQVGSSAGLAPTPYDSGDTRREQGISKSGNSQVRWMIVELAWSWVRYQPDSVLTQWYRRRWDQNSRLRKIGIVAVARKLLISLWRYVELGEVPQGAQLATWQSKLKGPCQNVA